MRLLVVGKLNGQLSNAVKMAMTAGAKVSHVETIEAATHALRAGQGADLMLLDIEMPRMDGFEVATQVRNDPRLMRLPIIMITSRTGQKHRDRAMAIGVNDYLGKPYQESVLLESIAYWSQSHA